jgi:hypothetical protein
MKYIKEYENVKYFYNPPVIGEYYLVIRDNDFYKAQLVDILGDTNPDYSTKYVFDIYLDDDFYRCLLSSIYIERELTPSEIEIYKMKKEVDKYNL